MLIAIHLRHSAQNDDQAGGRALPEGGDLQHDQTVVDEGDEKDAQQSAGDIPVAAADPGAAQNHRRNHVQLAPHQVEGVAHTLEAGVHNAHGAGNGAGKGVQT